jgi:hypothetical protein
VNYLALFKHDAVTEQAVQSIIDDLYIKGSNNRSIPLGIPPIYNEEGILSLTFTAVTKALMVKFPEPTEASVPNTALARLLSCGYLNTVSLHPERIAVLLYASHKYKLNNFFRHS